MKKVAINKSKVSGELYQFIVMLNNIRLGRDFKKLSPTTKEVFYILDDIVRSCHAALKDDETIVFELIAWQQLPLTGAMFSAVEPLTGAPDEPPDFETSDELYGIIE